MYIIGFPAHSHCQACGCCGSHVETHHSSLLILYVSRETKVRQGMEEHSENKKRTEPALSPFRRGSMEAAGTTNPNVL